MPTLQRREFLQGIIGGVTAAGVIVTASKADVLAFASPLGSPVTLAPEPIVQTVVSPGEHLYNAKGQIVALVTDVSFYRQPMDVTSWNDTNTQYVMGSLDINIKAKGFNHDKWGPIAVCTYCGTSRPFNLPCRQCSAGGV